MVGGGTLRLEVLDVAPERYAATPTLIAHTRISRFDGVRVQAIALRAQVRIEPARRAYDDAEAAGLVDLFGDRERWAGTQRAFLWMHTSTMVPAFTDQIEVDLPMPCTYDLEVSGSKYFHALADGSVPLLFLFSGTVFVDGPAGFSVEHISWDRESRHQLPVAVWRELMATSYPGQGWVRLREETLAALRDYKSAHGLLGYDDVVTTLLSREAIR